MRKKEFKERIKLARLALRETQLEFGNRFGVTGTAVSLWEGGIREAPYRVLYFVEEALENIKKCPTCKGTGIIERVPNLIKKRSFTSEVKEP